jgi:hypothetical protein
MERKESIGEKIVKLESIGKWKGRRAWEKSEVKKRAGENKKEGEHGRKVR